MDSLLRFGLGSVQSFAFVPAYQTEYQDNFSNIKQQGVTVPGKDGVINPYGMGRGPAVSGNVSVRFWVHGDDSGDVGYQVARIRELGYWGVRRLFKLHQNGDVMWTWASVSSVQTPQVVRRMPHKRQQVQMTFQCVETKWYSRLDQAFLNDDLLLDGTWTLPDLQVDQESVSDGSTVSVTNRGNSPVSAYVRWDGNGSDTFENPVITRRNWLGEIVDQLTYTDALGVNDVVEIDARALSCTDVSKLTAAGLSWLTIPPGTWDLEISGTFAGTANLSVDFWDGWV